MKSDQILTKLAHILESDPDSIVENKDIFMQILTAVDQETVKLLFKPPKAKKQTSELPLPHCMEETKRLTE